MAGLEPDAFSAHGLRAGYLTEAARQGIALPEAMQQSQHRSVQQAASYYNEAERAQGLDLDSIFDYAYYVRYSEEIVGRLDRALARLDQLT